MPTDVSKCNYTPQPDGLPRYQIAELIGFWVLLFSVNFSVMMAAMERYWPRFRKYSKSQKGDNASRVNSSLHAVLVCPSLLYALYEMEWGPNLEPLKSPHLFQAALTISVGYFICDFFVLWLYHTPKWQIFMLHHVMAVIPYLIYMFAKPCDVGVKILACYMLVELTNLTYNAKLWLEEIGNTRSKLYAFLLYASAAEWLVFRNFLPAWSVWASHARVIPCAPNGWGCLGPGVFCGYFVNLFCGVAFYVVFVTEIRDRWQGKGTWALGEAYEKAHQKKKAHTNGEANGSDSNGHTASATRSRSHSKGRKPSAKGRGRARKEG